MTGMMAGAPPTSPGGMSQKALVKELIDKHGWTKEQAKAQRLLDLSNWPVLIEMVVMARLAREEEARLDREAEQQADPVAAAMPEAEAAMARLFEQHGVEVVDDDFDPEELMAELTTIREEQEQYTLAHGLLIKEPGTLNYTFDGHAGAGPSSSERWLTCTASVGASRAFLETLTPNQQETFANANSAARQGTTAHAAAEVEAQVILGGLTQEEANLTLLELTFNPEVEDEAYDDEMGEYITEYVDLVKSYAQERGNESVIIEQRVSAAVPLTGMHTGEVYEIPGSVDCGVLPTPEEPVLVAADLKYGNGIWVGVDENSQAMIYALGLLALMVNDEGRLPEWLKIVRLHIVQPRMDGIKTAEMSVDDLLDWRDEVLAPALTAALYGDAEGAKFVPTEGGCQFCPARGGCAALAEHRMEAAAGLFDAQVEAEFEHGPGAFPETGAMTDTRLGELYVQIAGLQDIFKDIKAEAERRLYRGDKVPGLTLVNYQPPRKWKEGADDQISDDLPLTEEQIEALYLRRLVTPTQAEKMLGEDYAAIEALVDKPDKRPVVAKEGDRRKVWDGRPPESMFDDESGEQ